MRILLSACNQILTNIILAGNDYSAEQKDGSIPLTYEDDELTEEFVLPFWRDDHSNSAVHGFTLPLLQERSFTAKYSSLREARKSSFSKHELTEIRRNEKQKRKQQKFSMKQEKKSKKQSIKRSKPRKINPRGVQRVIGNKNRDIHDFNTAMDILVSGIPIHLYNLAGEHNRRVQMHNIYELTFSMQVYETSSNDYKISYGFSYNSIRYISIVNFVAEREGE